MARRPELRGDKSKSRRAAMRTRPSAPTGAGRSASQQRAAGKGQAGRRGVKPIELYYWPTSNGFKISIMFEECRLPYVVKPVNIAKGDQFDAAFLAISPNNRIPAIVDPNGPGGRSISIFESGAILQYLARKTGKFYPRDERGRVEVDQWLFWQVGGVGPMAGQANHFKNYARENIPYAIARYVDEVNRLYGVMNKRLADRDFIAGRYSIADMALIGWVSGWERQGQDIEQFPHLKRWIARMKARPAVARGLVVGQELRQGVDMKNPKVQAVLFGQRAR
ncbi:glutathione S-transferase N-terminal domain-containing protein [Pseudolabrys sp. Root1462]|uniref:glutathione S-transferase family protein n=1 Tax=Pseudolabrys sp. Root1462 TaxID=1736466 RepID=UPI000A7D6616|nr:glutathione S-transferase N-terminal domain-containing protein [Pseudolabrys sp. Root1462]